MKIKKIITNGFKVFRAVVFFLFLACSPAQSFKSGIKYTWKSTDTIESVAKQFNVDPIILRQNNGIYEPEDLTEGRIILIPKDSSALIEAPETPKISRNNLQFAWPSQGSLSSKYGKRWKRFHYGIDIRSNAGKDILAAEDGYVTFTGSQKGFGKVITIKHSQDYSTLYAHNEKIFVSKGQKVLKGSKIAFMGRTGRVTGIHLHFEVHKNGKPVNPLKVLPSRGFAYGEEKQFPRRNSS